MEQLNISFDYDKMLKATICNLLLSQRYKQSSLFASVCDAVFDLFWLVRRERFNQKPLESNISALACAIIFKQFKAQGDFYCELKELQVACVCLNYVDDEQLWYFWFVSEEGKMKKEESGLTDCSWFWEQFKNKVILLLNAYLIYI